jgi:hypothetical protein
MGQTGGSLYIKYKEHVGNIRCNKEDVGYAAHAVHNIHQYGKAQDIKETIDSAKKKKKGQIIEVKENFCVCMYIYI